MLLQQTCAGIDGLWLSVPVKDLSYNLSKTWRKMYIKKTVQLVLQEHLDTCQLHSFYELPQPLFSRTAIQSFLLPNRTKNKLKTVTWYTILLRN